MGLGGAVLRVPLEWAGIIAATGGEGFFHPSLKPPCVGTRLSCWNDGRPAKGCFNELSKGTM